MAVTSLTVQWQGREASETIEGQRSATVIYQGITNDRSDDHTVFSGHPLLPNLGDPHPNDATIFCRNIEPRTTTEDGRVWLITVFYSNFEIEAIDNPIIQPSVRTYSTERNQRAAIRDKDNAAIVNSAGFPFDPSPQRDESRVTISIVKHLPEVPTWILDYADAVNSNTFSLDGLTIGPRVAKVHRINVTPEKERNGVVFKTLDLVIQLRRETWDFVILNRGYIARIDNGDDTFSYYKVLGTDALPLPHPSLLDVNGTDIDLTSLTTPGAIAAAATYSTYRVYDELDFSKLPLT